MAADHRYERAAGRLCLPSFSAGFEAGPLPACDIRTFPHADAVR